MARFLLIKGERQRKIREISFSAEFTRIHTHTHTALGKHYTCDIQKSSCSFKDKDKDWEK